MVGIRSVDARLLELGRSLRATRRQVLTTLEIPAALPNILGGLRVGVTLAVVGAIVGEWAGASEGLGVLDQPRPRLAVRHPADVRHAAHDRPRGRRALSRRRRRRTPARRRPLTRIPASNRTEVLVSSSRRRSRQPRRSSSPSSAALGGRLRRCRRSSGVGAALEPRRSRRLGDSPSRASRRRSSSVGLGYIPSVQFAQFYLAQQAGYYAEAGLDVEFQNKIDPDLVPLVGAGHDRHRHRRRDERHPGRQPGHPDPLRRDDLRPVPEHRVRQGVVGDQRRRPT